MRALLIPIVAALPLAACAGASGTSPTASSMPGPSADEWASLGLRYDSKRVDEACRLAEPLAALRRDTGATVILELRPLASHMLDYEDAYLGSGFCEHYQAEFARRNGPDMPPGDEARELDAVRSLADGSSG